MRGARRASRALVLGGGTLGVLVLLLVATAGATPAAASPWNPSPGTGSTVAWTNGVVQCRFSLDLAGVVVSPPNTSGTGLALGFGSMSEMSSSGAVATANMSVANWTVENRTAADAYSLAYSLVAPVLPAGGGPALGNTTLTVTFSLPAYTGEGTSLDTVTLTLGVAGWPWQSDADLLLLTVPVAPAGSTGEAIAAGSGSGWALTNNAASSGEPLEWLAAEPNATASAPSPVAMTASPSLALNDGAGVLSIRFEGHAGGYDALSYTMQLGVVLPTAVAGIPLADLAAVGGAGAVVSVLIAVGARRLRRRPSDLVYVEERTQ